MWIVKNVLRGSLRFAEVAEHPVRTSHEQQSFYSKEGTMAGRRVDDFRGHTRQRVPDRSRTRATLVFAPMIHIRDVDRNHWRHLRTAVPFEQIDAKFFLESGRDRLT